ncbi:MAG: MarR family transcriptional regulator [Pseudomonadota bacterium]
MFFLKELPTAAMLEGYAARYPDMEAETVSAALTRLRWASLTIRALEAYFAEHGLSQTQFLILMAIDREPERESLLPSEIADRLDISRPIVTNAITRLERTGLVAWEPQGADRRRKPLRLSAAGRERLDALLPGYFRLIHERMAASRGQ